MKRTEAYRQFLEEKLRERYPTFILHGRTSFQPQTAPPCASTP